jgi:cytidine deaminase
VNRRSEAPPVDLVAAARTAFERAYAPYSGFGVGAALRAADGRIFAGANVENASYGLARCAEQSAVQAMVSAGQRRFDTLVVYVDGAVPASPCGACRQVLHEFAPDATVWLVAASGDARITSVAALLPEAFSLSRRSTEAAEDR